MSEKPLMEPWVGQTLRKYRKQKGWVQEELGQKMAEKMTSRSGRQEKGLSKSAISRIEKNTFVPPQDKLELMIELLNIQDPAEQKRLFEACGYTFAQPAHWDSPSREELLSQQLKTQNWPDKGLAALALLSLYNQEQRFSQALELISELQLELSRSALDAALKEYIQAQFASKQQRALYGQTQQIEALERSLSWAELAIKQSQTLPAEFQPKALWCFEAYRCRISAAFLLFVQRDLTASLSNLSNEKALAQHYQSIAEDIDRAQKLLQEKKENAHRESEWVYRRLYLQRESTRLQVKWLEYQELQELAQALQAHIPNPQNFHSMAQQLDALKGKKQAALDCVLQLDGNAWADLAQQNTAFFEEHQALIDAIQSPQDLPRVPIVNTALLYCVALTRCRRHAEAQQLLATLFLMCNSHSLPTWYYISSYCAAWRYRENQDTETAHKLLSYWARWCQSRDADEHYDPQRFAACLHEPILWSSFLILQDHPAFQSWLAPKLQHALSTQTVTELSRAEGAPA